MVYYLLLTLFLHLDVVAVEGTFSTLEECNKTLEWLNINPYRPEGEYYKCIEVSFEGD